MSRYAIGPLISDAAIEKVERHVADAIERRARALVGGRRQDAKAGFSARFYEPTVLAEVPDGALVLREETFGPVVPIQTFGTECHEEGPRW